MCWVEVIRSPQPEIRTTRRDAMPFVRCKSSSKNVTSRLKKCYSVYESVWEGSNIFARRVTVDEYKVPSKMSTNTSLVRTPSTDSHVEGVLRHHPCYFSNISAIFLRYFRHPFFDSVSPLTFPISCTPVSSGSCYTEVCDAATTQPSAQAPSTHQVG